MRLEVTYDDELEVTGSGLGEVGICGTHVVLGFQVGSSGLSPVKRPDLSSSEKLASRVGCATPPCLLGCPSWKDKAK
jgi:hypothetical protein